MASSVLARPASAAPRASAAAARPRRAAARAAATVGEKAPAPGVLIGDDFKTIDLAAMPRPLVLAFFPAAFSGAEDDGCTCQLNALKAVADDGAAVLGVSKELPFSQGAFMKELGLPFPIAYDKDLATAEAFVGTFDLGAFLDKVGLSTDLAGYVTTNRGCVVLGEGDEVLYSWVGLDENGESHPGLQPPTEEIKAALGTTTTTSIKDMA